MTLCRSLIAPVLFCSLLLVSCNKDEEKPILQQDSTAPAPAPATGGVQTVPAPIETIPDTATTPHIATRTPASPKEKGDSYPEYFLGMEGKFAKEIPPDGEPATLVAIRTAQYEMFDRVVFEFDATRAPGYEIGYLDEPATDCGSGKTVRVKGKSVLQLKMFHARAHTEEGQPTLKEKEYQPPSYPAIKEIKRTCDFEGTVMYVVGVSSRHKIRLLELRDPSRLVLDIRNDKELPESLIKKK